MSKTKTKKETIKHTTTCSKIQIKTQRRSSNDLKNHLLCMKEEEKKKDLKIKKRSTFLASFYI